MSGLPTLERIRAAVAARPAELAELRAAGATVVGYFCCNVAEELILAAGMIPVRLGSGGDERLVEIGGRYISHQNCPFVRQNVGVFAEAAEAAKAGGEPQDPLVANTDIVVTAATCPQIYRMAEVVEHFFGPTVEVLGVPRNFTSEEGKEYFRNEVADLARRLELRGGQAVTPQRLAPAVALLAEIRTSIKTLYRLQAEYGEVLTWRETFEAVHAGFSLDRAEYAGLLADLIGEVTTLAAQSELDAPTLDAPTLASAELDGSQLDVAEPGADELDEPIRLFLSGTIVAPGDTKIIDLVEELGGRIVGDDLCTGLRPSLQLVVAEPTVSAVADAYLDRVQCAALPHLTLNQDRRLTNVKASYAASGAEGIIYHSLRYCDPFTFKAGETKQVLGRDVPFLEIHTEYATSDTEGIRTRIDAFLEMIYAARLRKEPADVGISA